MRKFDRSVSLLCWAYNEEASIAEYLSRAAQLMDSTVEDFEIVLIDDGSTDRTCEIARAFQASHPRLKIFRNPGNLGVGISSRVAIQRATKEYLFWQTVDWSYDISDLGRFLGYLRIYDIVQGVRTSGGEGDGRLRPLFGAVRLFSLRHLHRRSDTWQKGLVSVINYVLIRILFQVPLSDFQNVTFYPTRWIQSLRLEGRSSFANPEGLIKSYWNGMRIKEVPINFLPRRQGTPKGTSFSAIKASVEDIVILWLRWVVFGGRGRVRKGQIILLDPAGGDQHETTPD